MALIRRRKYSYL